MECEYFGFSTEENEILCLYDKNDLVVAMFKDWDSVYYHKHSLKPQGSNGTI